MDLHSEDLSKDAGGSLMSIMSSHSTLEIQAATLYKGLLESSFNQGHVSTDLAFGSLDDGTLF